ncbi:MAG: hypothetical protein HC800_17160 [Phormidesmis sp. RL_2_1]|nr:hypothetical protein [Phormidesmis sp. RL_2_1]
MDIATDMATDMAALARSTDHNVDHKGNYKEVNHKEVNYEKVNHKVDAKISHSYHQQWTAAEKVVRRALDDQLASETFLGESKLVWLLSQHLPAQTPLFIANSMPVRDVEYFWQPNNRQIQPVFSRGANGIDGTLSTAMGLAHRNRPTVLLTGDLAFLHDTNGLLNAAQLAGHLTIILINNHGGGIFEMLPVAQFEPEFEKYFVTPQQVNFAGMCQSYGVDYALIQDAEDLVARVSCLPEQGMRVLEVRCDRKQSVQQRKMLLSLPSHLPSRLPYSPPSSQ